MGSNEYKALCGRKNSFKREWLEKTAVYLSEVQRKDLLIEVENTLKTQPIEKPHEFQGDKRKTHEEIAYSLFVLESQFLALAHTDKSP